MATKVIRIVITTQGAKKAAAAVGGVGNAARRSAGGINVLKRAMGLLTVGLVARQFVEMSDSVVSLRNRLAILTDSTIEITSATRELFDISKETRSSFDSTINIYSRLALAARALGESQDSLLGVTKAINQATILSGTSAREARNGLIQLSQAIASNRLGGDELRSVLEQLPLVADIVGKELVRVGLAIRGTRGEVRKLGFEGKITSRIMIDAFKNASQELEDDFGKTIVTIGQAFEVLVTETTRLVTGANEATGANTLLADSVLLLADNLDKVAAVVGFLVSTAVIRGMIGLGAAMTFAAAPLTIVAAGLAAIGIGAVAVGNKFGFFRREVDRFNEDALKEAADAMKDLGRFDPQTQQNLRALNEEIQDMETILRAASGQKFFDKILGPISPEKIKETQDRLIRARNLVAQLTREGTAQPELVLEEENRLKKLALIEAQLKAQLKTQKESNNERLVSVQIDRIRDRLKGDLRSDEESRLRVAVQMIETQKRLNKLTEEIAGPTRVFAEIQRDLNTLLESGKISLGQYNIQLGISKLEYLDSLDPIRQTAQIQRVLNELYQEGTISLEALREKLLENRVAVLEFSGTLGDSLKAKFLGLKDTTLDLSDAISAFGSRTLDGFTSSLVEMASTGKASFKDLASSILKDLAAIALKMLIVRAIGGLGKLAGGGLGEGLTSFAGFLKGARNGADFTVGGSGGTDSQTVAFRATPGERVTVQTPAQQQSGSGGVTNISFNISTPDPNSFGRSQGQLTAQALSAMTRQSRRNN